MAIHIDVLTELDERSLLDSARRMTETLTSVGERAGPAIGHALADAMGIYERDQRAALDRVVADFDRAGVAIGASLTAGLVTAAGSLLKIGEQFENISRGLILTTDATGQALDELRSHADAMVGSLDTSVNALGNTMGTLATRLEMGPGAALDTLTRHVTELGDRFKGLDVAQLSAGFVQFGVDGQQADNVLASLLQTSQQYAVSLPSLASNLASFGVTLKAAHLDMEQAAHMMGLMEKAGVPLQQGLMGLEVAAKSWAKPEMGKGRDFVTFMRDAAESMEYYNKVRNTVARDEIAVNIFGQRRWEQAEQAAQAYLDTIRLLPGALEAPAGHIDHVVEGSRNLGNAWQQFRNELSHALEPTAIKFVDELSGKLHEFGEWAKGHQDDLRRLFEGAAEIIGGVITALKKITEVLGGHPELIRAVFDAFVTWEAIRGITAVVAGLNTITTMLRAMPAAAATAGTSAGAAMGTGFMASLSTAMGPLAIAALGAQVGSTLAHSIDEHLHTKFLERAMVPGSLLWLVNIAEHPENLLKFGGGGHPSSTGGLPPGVGGPGGQPPPGGVAGPGHAGLLPGQVVPTPTAPPPPPAHHTPGWGGDTSPGGVGAGIPLSAPPGLITPEDFDTKGGKKGKGPRLPAAPELPLPPEYGGPPGAGENASVYNARMRLIEDKHKEAEARARVDQLEHTANVNENDLNKARNTALEAHKNVVSAEMELSKAQAQAADEQARSLRTHGAALQEFGAKLDQDFGISKGLPGIAENLFKFLANLAFAPVFGALGGATAAMGGVPPGASGLMGMGAAAGMFGPAYQQAFMPGMPGMGGSAGIGRGGGGGRGRGGFGPGAMGNMGGGFGAAQGKPTIKPPDEYMMRQWAAENFGIPNSFGTGSWENAAHDADGAWHHNLTHDKSVPGYAFDFHSDDRAQMDALANWIATNDPQNTLELIYGGMDPSREIKNSRYSPYSAATNRDHNDHVHWALTAPPWMGGMGMDDAAFPGDAGAGMGGPQAAIFQQMLAAGFDPSEWPALNNLITSESSWNPGARNPKSGAQGLFQFLGHQGDKYGALGGYSPDPSDQGRAGMAYIADRYGSPGGAWNHWQQAGSYDTGGAVPSADSSGVPQPSILDPRYPMPNLTRKTRDNAILGEGPQFPIPGAGGHGGLAGGGSKEIPIIAHGGAWNHRKQAGSYDSGGEVGLDRNVGGPDNSPVGAPGDMARMPMRDQMPWGFSTGSSPYFGGSSKPVPIIAHGGEYVIQKAAVDHYGPGMMAAINARHFDVGGPVADGPPQPPPPPVPPSVGTDIHGAGATPAGFQPWWQTNHEGSGAPPGPTKIGGGAPERGKGQGAHGTGGGAIGGATQAAAMAADAFAPGSGVAVQIASQELQRLVQYGAQVAGAGVQGILETVLPAGGSKLAQNNWITKIASGIAGARPQIPNLAGAGENRPSPEGMVGRPNPLPAPTGGRPGINLTYNNYSPISTESQAGADINRQLEAAHSGAGQALAGGR